MKKILLSLLVFPLLFGCEEKDDAVYETNLLVGKWKMIAQTRNDVPSVFDNDCYKDKLWEFKSDGMVYNNNPCESVEEKVNKSGSWQLKGNILHIDGMVQLSAVPKVLRLTDTEMELEYMYGSYEVVREVFHKTQDNIVDYARDISGSYSGWAYSSSQPLTAENKGDSAIRTVVIDKMWTNIIWKEFQKFPILDKTRTFKVDSVNVNSFGGTRGTYMYPNLGFDELIVGGKAYNVMTSGYYKNDSAWINLSINLLGAPMEYHYFVGTKVK